MARATGRVLMGLAGAGIAAVLAGCATGPGRAPVEAVRFHYDPVAERGTVAVEPLEAAGYASIEYKTYAAAVETELLRLGFTPAQPGTVPLYRASVSFARTSQALPPRRSPVSIGLGGGGFSGGGYRGGGVGLGGGISFPIGRSRPREAVVTELGVQLRRGPDAVWEGRAHTVTDASAPDGAAGPVAARLAGALFSGFPGESGRTIEVK